MLPHFRLGSEKLWQFLAADENPEDDIPALEAPSGDGLGFAEIFASFP